MICFLFAPQAHAQTTDPYYQTTQSITEIESTEDPANQTLDPLSNQPSDDPTFLYESAPFISLGIGPLTIVEGLIKLWEIIQDNRAVVKTDFKGGSALPEVAGGEWAKITGWKPERTVTYVYTAINGFKQKVVDLKYKVTLRYGGSVKGKGQYIASARVTPLNIQVLWGFSLSVDVQVTSTDNSGSEKDPIASMHLNVIHKMKNKLGQSSTDRQSYFVKGDGYIEDTRTGKIFFESESETPSK